MTARRLGGWWWLAGLLATALPLPAAAEVTRTAVELVVDASAGTWTELPDGRPRLAAERAALDWLLLRLSGDAARLRIGVRAYGSQTRLGDPGGCADSSLLVPVGELDAQPIPPALRELAPGGEAALALALRDACEDLTAIDASQRVVVAVVASAESCGGDLAAAVSELEVAGVELVVVGVGLAPQALARLTPLTAVDATAGGRSLEQTLGCVFGQLGLVDEQPREVTVSLTREGTPIDDAVVELAGQGSGDLFPCVPQDGVYRAAVPPGLYSVRARDLVLGEQALDDVAVGARSPQTTVAFELAPPAGATLAVAPTPAEAGGEVTLTIGAVGALPGWVGLAPRQLGVEGVAEWKRVDGDEEKLRLPDRACWLVAGYVVDLPTGGRRIAATSAFLSQATTAVLEVPEEVVPSGSFTVTWDGPGSPGDRVLVPPLSGVGPPLAAVPVSAGDPLELVAPAAEGSYEVTYASGLSGQALGQTVLRVKKPEATLQAPERVLAGEPVAVAWTGPNLEEDIVALAQPTVGADEYTEFAETATGSPAVLRAPTSPGTYEVRYVHSGQHRVVARRPLEVVLPEVSLRVPPTVPPKVRFKVSWSGPDGSGDFVTVVPKGLPESQFKEWAYTTVGSPLTLPAPDAPGAYEVRYVRGKDRKVLLSVPLKVAGGASGGG